MKSRGVKFIFLDRDGVINRDPGGWTKYDYVTRWDEFRFLPGALEALKKLNNNGFRVILISNQAGVSKGYFSKDDLDKITARMTKEIRESGGNIEAVYYCIHRDEDNCDCRKPKTGLLEKAAKKYGIELNKTYFIGDTKVDIIAGRRVGTRTIFVASGKTADAEMERWDEKPDRVFGGLLEAVKWLIGKERRKSDRASRRD